ncbi:MAG: response regulator transcription factor [Sphingobacteriales bacterium]|nr:response regulator transcription factor [Sphingobacteriales bacterium]
MLNTPIRIILVDDHKAVRKSWKALLENNPLFKIIADCENGDSAINEAERLHPDIMLVDINMSPLNGFMVTQKVLEKVPDVKIIGLSVNNLPKYADKMIALGAKGYLTKTSALEEIFYGIIRVYNGEIFICEEVKKQIKTPNN